MRKKLKQKLNNRAVLNDPNWTPPEGTPKEETPNKDTPKEDTPKEGVGKEMKEKTFRVEKDDSMKKIELVDTTTGDISDLEGVWLKHGETWSWLPAEDFWGAAKHAESEGREFTIPKAKIAGIGTLEECAAHMVKKEGSLNTMD